MARKTERCSHLQFDSELWTRSLSEVVRTIAAWAPRLAGALVWLVIGWVVARLAQFILAGLLRRLQVQTTLLTTTAIALVAATAQTLALSFGIGSRELAHNIMAGFHAKEAFNAGQQLKVRGHTGRLVSIGPVKTVIETDGGLISLPNSVLTNEVVTIVKENTESKS